MAAQEQIIMLYIPCPDYQVAECLSKNLLEKKLIFCSNLFQNMSSLYLWNGEIQQGQEVIMIAKTLIGFKEQVTELIEKQHPYEQVVIMSFPSEGSSEGLLKWAVQELKK